MNRHSDKRDGNEAELVRHLQRRGLHAIRMGRGVGFDLLVIDEQTGRMLPPVEVKNPFQSWSFTDSERRMIELCRRVGLPYLVLERFADVDALANGDYAQLNHAPPAPEPRRCPHDVSLDEDCPHCAEIDDRFDLEFDR